MTQFTLKRMFVAKRGWRFRILKDGKIWRDKNKKALDMGGYLYSMRPRNRLVELAAK